MPRKYIPLEQRIPALLGPPTALGCRPWLGSRNRGGYGRLKVHNAHQAATHAVWFLHTGHWPTRAEVIAHHCDWPPCCEFTHLFLTDTAGNNADSLAKGRRPRGEQHGRVHLTEPDVRTMRRRYAAGDVTMPALAREFGVCYATARSAIKGETWRHVL